MSPRHRPRSDRPPRSPRVTHLERGQIRVEGFDEPLKDVKLYPGGAHPWDWRETGTQHEPGIQPADVEELLHHGANIIVLSRGMDGRLKVPDDTRVWLRDHGVIVVEARTEDAVHRYNEFVDNGEPVGALLHSTC